MPAGYRMSVSHVVEMMLAGVGQRGSDDLKYHWFETIYAILREQPWPWNWAWTRVNTYAPFEPAETYTWSAGDTTLVASAASTVTNAMVGRKILVDNIPYRIVKTISNGIDVDAPLHEAGAAVSLTIYRSDLCIKTSSLYNVDVNGYKCRSSTPDFWKGARGDRNIAYEGAQPTEYEIKEEFEITPPLYAPALNGAAGVGVIEAGIYEYFWTKYDSESGLESAPGPSVQVTHAATVKQSMKYSNPAADNTSEDEGYALRLWRSKVDPTGERYAAWLVGSKVLPFDNTEYIEDNLSDALLIANERFYDGNRTLIEWHLWADDVYPVRARHLYDYSGRPDPLDVIPIGRNNIANELLQLGASAFIELANKDTQAQQMAIVKFRQQLGYLVKKTSAANADDDGLEETTYFDGIPDDGSMADPTLSYRWHY